MRQAPRDGAQRRLVPLMAVSGLPGYAWITTRWLRRQVGERRIPFHKVAGKVLVDLDDLDRLAESGRVEPADVALFQATRRRAGGRPR